jgi:hypothetical protein
MRKVSRAALAAPAALMALMLPSAASGATTSNTVSLGSSSLAFSTAPQADPIAAATINGRMQTLHTTFHSWGVTDARGTGTGWTSRCRPRRSTTEPGTPGRPGRSC